MGHVILLLRRRPTAWLMLASLRAAAYSGFPPPPWRGAPPGPGDDFDLFRMGDLGFSHFRIPVLATIEGLRAIMEEVM